MGSAFVILGQGTRVDSIIHPHHMQAPSSPPNQQGATEIPKVIHFIWFGPSVPDYERQCIQEWKNAHQPLGWTTRVWRDKDFDPQETPEFSSPQAQEILLRIQAAVKPAQKADIGRYLILERFGGVYLDTDMKFVKAFDQFCIPLSGPGPRPTLIVCNEDATEKRHFCSNAFIACTPHHPALQNALELVKMVGVNAKGIHYQTGPYLWVLCFDSNSPECLWLPMAHFYPLPFDKRHEVPGMTQNQEFDWSKKFPQSYGVHLWNASWVEP